AIEYLTSCKFYRENIYEKDKKFSIENFTSTFYNYKVLINVIKNNEEELENFTLATMAQDEIIF
ncbi:13177_t:CDS:1, partial [Gigaspora margarita]